MAHSLIRVAKAALQQLRKCSSWVPPLEDLEGIDQEAIEGWVAATQALEAEIHAWLESQA